MIKRLDEKNMNRIKKRKLNIKLNQDRLNSKLKRVDKERQIYGN